MKSLRRSWLDGILAVEFEFTVEDCDYVAVWLELVLELGFGLG